MTESPAAGSLLKPFHAEFLQRMLPVDVVLAPHQLKPLELIEIRFITKVLYDLRQVPSFEPFRRFFRVGELTAEIAEAKGGVTADALLERYGGDALRLKLIGLGPLANPASFRTSEIRGVRRFLDRAWRECLLRIEKGRFVSRRVLEQKHRMIYRVADRLRRFKFHTALSSIREFVKFLVHPETTDEEMDRSALQSFAIVLSPFAPHLAQELWERLGKEGSVHEAAWPEYSQELLTSPQAEVMIWIDGRVRDRMTQPVDLPAARLESLALERENVRRIIGAGRIERVIAIPGRLVSIALAREEANEGDAPGSPRSS